MIEELCNNSSAEITKEMKLIPRTNITYSIGLKGNHKLIVNDETLLYEIQSSSGAFVKLEINKDDFRKKLYNKNIEEEWIEIDDELKFGTVDLSNKGDRWEGDCLNGNPCGYGIIFDYNNNLVYRGFVFDGKKVCVGEEYYDDRVIRYRGTYMNDYRHGYGCLYNRKGELIYKGEWSLNENDVFNVNIPNECVDDELIHNLTYGLIIGDKCYNDLSKLILNGYPNLTVLIVGSESFTSIESFELTNCKKLKELTIADGSMKNTKSCKFLSM